MPLILFMQHPALNRKDARRIPDGSLLASAAEAYGTSGYQVTICVSGISAIKKIELKPGKV